MTLTQITYFETVCEYKNVTKAAEALFVSRSAVSRSLKELENEWNLVLFKRSRTGVELTEDGAMLRNMFKEFISAYTSLKSHINDARRTNQIPRLNIGISLTTGAQFFPDFFPPFIDNNSDIDLRFHEYASINIHEALNTGDCDFFISPHLSRELRADKALDYKLMGHSEMVVCVSATHKLAQRDRISLEEASKLKRASLMTHMSVDIMNETLVYSILGSEDDPNIVITTSQQELIHKMVASGHVVSILPKDYTTHWDDIATISLDPVNIISYYMIWKKDILKANACKRFYDYFSTYNFPNI